MSSIVTCRVLLVSCCALLGMGLSIPALADGNKFSFTAIRAVEREADSHGETLVIRGKGSYGLASGRAETYRIFELRLTLASPASPPQSKVIDFCEKRANEFFQNRDKSNREVLTLSVLAAATEPTVNSAREMAVISQVVSEKTPLNCSVSER